MKVTKTTSNDVFKRTLAKKNGYEFVTNGEGYVGIKYKGKVIATGDYDDGPANAFFFDVPWNTKAQQGYKSAMKGLDDFIKYNVTTDVSSIDPKIYKKSWKDKLKKESVDKKRRKYVRRTR